MRTQLSNVRANSIRPLLAAALGLALSFTFNACGEQDGGSTNGLCGGKSYDPNVYRCEMGELVGKCRGVDYYAAYEQCVNGAVVSTSQSSVSSGGKSSSSAASSSSSIALSSSLAEPSSSSNAVPSSSSVVPSSSSTPPSSSSSLAPSSSSAVPSSSSIAVPSSSSIAPSSSSVCTRLDITDTHYCSFGTLKQYGFMDYGGQTYKTTVIGTQTWMAENLNYAASGSKCGNSAYRQPQLINENTQHCDTRGRLYDWSTAMALPSNCNSTPCASRINAKHRGVCPAGWHIPSYEEIDTLRSYVASDNGYDPDSYFSGLAYYLKVFGESNTCFSNGARPYDNPYGFSALLGSGYGSIEDDIISWSSNVSNSGSAYWWTTSERYVPNPSYPTTEADCFSIYCGNDDVGGTIKKARLLSVRCIKD